MNYSRFGSRTALVILFLFCVAVRAEKVALTFDDLPLNGQLPNGVSEADIAKRALAILKARKVPQVFGFANTKKLIDNPAGQQALQLWVAAGQRLGSHTYSHLDLHISTPAEFFAEIDANEPALKALSGKADWHWFRYPYLREGDTVLKRREVRAYLEKRRYKTAQVTLDYEDYLWNTPYARCAAKSDSQAIAKLRESYISVASRYLDADRKMAELVFHRPIDHVLLLHLGAFTEEILPSVLDLLRDKGFTLATLEEVQKDAAYKTDPDAGSRYGGTLLDQWMDARHIPYPAVEKKPVKELEALCR